MKRSEINALIDKAKTLFQHNQIRLPPFAFWKPEEWLKKGAEADEIRNNRLGWDLTDFGSGCFPAVGLLLFTIRNGNLGDPANKKHYAEKVMLVEEGQVTPFHFHWLKTEDIINRGGGNLVVELFNSDADDNFTQEPIQVSCDGVKRTVEPGGSVVLRPGESITLVPRLYHKFYGQNRAGRVIVGEVSSVNDDASDNRFKEPAGRFPKIDEDAPPLHHLCHEYPRAQS